MQPQDSQILESYVPVYDVAPDKWEDARPFIVEQLKSHANAINVREIGFYIDEELLSGKAFIPSTEQLVDSGDSQQFRSILRKVIDFGALPNATTKSIPHDIVFDMNFTLIQLWASATDPINFIAIPIPFDSAGLAQGIQITMDATYINIKTQSNRSTFTRCFVIIEYIQEL